MISSALLSSGCHKIHRPGAFTGRFISSQFPSLAVSDQRVGRVGFS